MPLLFPPGTWVRDADGNPLNDAKVRVYLQNTTSYANLYSDAALSVPLSNPVITNAAGYPTSDGSNETLIWVASGDYDTAFLTSADAVLVGWPDAPTYGEGSGDIDLTVSGNGRFQVTGTAGAVQIHVGDPSPDDIGGTLTISGWNGTQADSVEINSALLNVVGALKVNSKKLPGVVYTEATTFTALVPLDIALPNVPAGVRGWRITLFDLSASAATSIWIRFSYDGGGTYKSGAADYAYGANYHASSTPTATASLGAAQINIPNILNAARQGALEMVIFTPNSGAGDTVVMGRVNGYESSSGMPTAMTFSGVGLGSYGRATHVRLTNSATAQSYTGKYRIEPIYGTGEA